MDILEKNKKIIPAAIVIVLVIAGAMLYNKIQNDRKNQPPPIITEKKPDLTEEQVKATEDRLAKVLDKIANSPENATPVEKYSWQMQAGFQKIALGKYLEAKEYFLAASVIQPAAYESWVALYDVAFAMNDFDSARENIKKAIALDSSNPALWKKYISLEKEKLKASDIELDKLFSEAFTRTRSDIEIVIYYAEFLEEKGDLKGATEQWKKAMALAPSDKEKYQAEVTRLEGRVK